jgi:hypothetical protein
MMTRFYLGLVSISFIAATSAWGMGHMAHEDFTGLKRSPSREIAPVPRDKHFGSTRTYSRSVPTAPSLVPAKRSSRSVGDIPQSAELQAQEEAKKLAQAQAAALQAFAKVKVSVEFPLGDKSFKAKFALTPIEN